MLFRALSRISQIFFPVPPYTLPTTGALGKLARWLHERFVSFRAVAASRTPLSAGHGREHHTDR